MNTYYLLYKPFGVLSQFTDETGKKKTLGLFYPFPKDVYSVGRLDEDSEGLLLLTNDNKLKTMLMEDKIEKEYWVQVEGIPEESDLEKLRNGITIRVKKKTHQTQPAKVYKIEQQPHLPERIPAIRYRKHIPTSWLSIILTEGKFRQVRKMTAAIGFPTLRLVRVRIGKIKLDKMFPGEVKKIESKDII
jgi:23S rRNA pseudouridine2457 synthase